MSEYPWDIENMMLEQHDQPCDCAICDEIQMNRAIRGSRMKDKSFSVTDKETIAEYKQALQRAKKERDEWHDLYDLTAGTLAKLRTDAFMSLDEVHGHTKLLQVEISDLRAALETIRDGETDYPGKVAADALEGK